MKHSNYIKSTLLLITLIITFSCSNEPCLGCQEDTIGLSKKEVQFSSETNSIVITTKGDNWWLSEINFNGNELNLSTTDTSLKQYKIEEPEFSFERKSTNEIIIQMNENNSKEERKLRFILTHLNYNAHLNFNQSAE